MLGYFQTGEEQLTNESKGRGGARPGSGPKPISETGEVMKIRSIRMTDDEWNKLLRLGGSAWIRERIKRAKDPVQEMHEEGND